MGEEKDGLKVQNMLIIDDDLKKKITREFEGGVDHFIIKALILPKDRKQIARALAIQYNGLPVNSFSIDDRMLFERDARIDAAIVEKPGWWKNAEDCPNEEILEWLEKEIIDHTNELDSKIKKNQLAQGGT